MGVCIVVEVREVGRGLGIGDLGRVG